jgi:hypothetical protein
MTAAARAITLRLLSSMNKLCANTQARHGEYCHPRCCIDWGNLICMVQLVSPGPAMGIRGKRDCQTTSDLRRRGAGHSGMSTSMVQARQSAGIRISPGNWRASCDTIVPFRVSSNQLRWKSRLGRGGSTTGACPRAVTDQREAQRKEPSVERTRIRLAVFLLAGGMGLGQAAAIAIPRRAVSTAFRSRNRPQRD